MSTKNPYGPFTGPPEYALAVSIIFTRATNQTIMLGTEPYHDRSTSFLWNSLVHDSRFKRVTISEALPGDIIIEPGWQNAAAGFVGIVADHGRVVSNSGQGVQNNSSLIEIQRSHPTVLLFRYIGVQGHRSIALANVFNPNEPRKPAGQAGGGRGDLNGLAKYVINDAMGGNTATMTVVVDTFGLSEQQIAALKFTIQALAPR